MNISLPLPPILRGVKTVVGLHITDKVIRLLEVDKDGKPVIEPIELKLEGKDKETALREIISEYKLSSKRVVTCVPVNDGLLKLYKYPKSMSKKDLQSAIEWSIKREISAMKEETYYDYFLLDEASEEKQIGVVTVISRKETVENIRKLIESVGLKLHILDYEIIAIINYGLYYKFPVPFSILYIDYNYSILVTYSRTNISYYVNYWNYSEFRESGDEESLENFFAEMRNIVVLNDLSSMYVAGPIIADEDMLTRIMENLPILGLLDLEGVKPSFFIPYILCIRGMEG